MSLESLPPYTGGRIPAFFFAHGSPMLLYPPELPMSFPSKIGGPNGPHKKFLKEFGKFLIDTYKPKAIVVFSAHWETDGVVEITNYKENPLLYDYYNFPKVMYDIQWKSHGSPEVANRVQEAFTQHGVKTKFVVNGERGLDHGVFIPFKIMFEEQPFSVPVVAVSIDSGLDPRRHVELGRALESLRDEGILILSGGLTIHTFRDFKAWDPDTAEAGYKDFQQQIIDAANDDISTPEVRTQKLIDVTKHPYFRKAHPREEHFIPIYVAAGAGYSGKSKVVSDLYGAITIAFGV